MPETMNTRSSEGGNALAEHAHDKANEVISQGHDMSQGQDMSQAQDEVRDAHLLDALSGDEETHRASPRAVEVAGLQPFAVEVQRRDDVAIVQSRGELDLVSVETLRAALDGIKSAARLVLDLRGLSFIDSTGLHLLVALHQRAQRDGFQLTLLAPAAPLDRAIQLCGLDKALPFVAPVDAIDSEPGASTSGPRGGR
jgi:anti-anti-sigma factor